jgi:hypothetical protein
VAAGAWQFVGPFHRSCLDQPPATAIKQAHKPTRQFRVDTPAGDGACLSSFVHPDFREVAAVEVERSGVWQLNPRPFFEALAIEHEQSRALGTDI